ncbi:FAD:protein FMN transferase ApbE [Candidatus Marinamargulisbacteria bacterium SCGC AG-333-B06]|nr:FAD:protein FMN transferase ApbE [Candidatus Marinamargulisbacteria bacterium SCGC AG-333-B06]
MNIKKRLVLFFLLVICPLLFIWAVQQKYMLIHGNTMGTTYTIKCYSPKWVNKNKVTLEVEKELKRINAIFSTWDAQSEISKFNNLKATKNIIISDDFRYLIQAAFELYDNTTGYFDPTVKSLSDIWGFSSYNSYFSIPKKHHIAQTATYVGLDKIKLNENNLRKVDPYVSMDLSAIVKGFAVDQVALLLEKLGSKKYMVEIGGEVRVLTNNDKKPWTIGIHKPKYHEVEQHLLGSIELKNEALATSGDYQNFFEKDGVIYSHIMDSKKGSPVRSKIASVSIIAPNCLLADGLATSVMAMGVNRGLSLIESYPNVEGLIVIRHSNNTLETYESSGFNKNHYRAFSSL